MTPETEGKLLRHGVQIVPLFWGLSSADSLWDAYRNGGIQECHQARMHPMTLWWITPDTGEHFQRLLTSHWHVLGLSILLSLLLACVMAPDRPSRK
ncbi:MAG: hypothetical protein IOC39_05800 [Burkholderia sp.]|jgi:hypothetical protein|uniref:hypothetical protein n=1 Tax=Burkholderia sp. TaxID=36773 RepID=UPI00258AA22C|nr:hypothetical protein [Burkholderia sp.]MCA3778714.1 hypothetical protein [Burkholderia sp.]MCA3785008.1 hypothetical protein [Burkholderia sp.]MCA3793117.1 hypothetical protein [Burkholderia sp.]MCA3805880.1 hypothetical protein [Burkholderia sp.]MCA3811370.1 hypothetical protein [Burkholderia sp.]